tara:strand:+ start:815 stop:1807 length:993 start_codon:yes stop_codon:yes gene_type:complete
MKKVKNNKTNVFKKIFIKIGRLLGYELLDQNTFESPTLNKKLGESLSIAGKKSISLPLGEVEITRKVKSLTIFFRSCSKIKLWNQNKERIFKQSKSEYLLRSLNSILKSINYLKNQVLDINISFYVIDDQSDEDVLIKIKNLFEKYNQDYQLTNLDSSEYKQVCQDTNFASIYKSYNMAKNINSDLIYFVEDDYVHHEISIHEMLLSFERLSSQLKDDVILFPADYPYLYAQNTPTYVLLGNKRHWRKIDQSLGTLMLSKKLFMKYWENFNEFATVKSDPAEKPLHRVYEKENCFSPIPSLAIHCTNINSIYGLSPNVDWEAIWNNAKLE